MLRSLPVHSTLLLLALAVLPLGLARAEPAVAVVARAEADLRVVDELERLGVAVSRRQLEGSLEASELSSATRDWSESRVLVVESASFSLRVLRRSDGLLLVRVFEPGFLEASPYAAALAASELLDMSAQTPVATASVAPPGPGQPSESPRPKERTTVRREWQLLLLAGGELAAALKSDAAMWRPLIGVGVEAGKPGGAFGLAQVVGAPFGTLTRPVTGGAAGDRVDYRRSDVGVRLGAGKRLLAGSALGYVAGGLGVVSASARSEGTRRAADRRSGSWFAAGGAFRYQPWRRVALVFGTELVWVPQPVTYLVRGRTTLREDSVRFGTSLALSLRLR